jgi:hypothetical protein
LIRAALRLRNDHGGVAVTFAVTITVVIGFAGAATEVGTWLLTRRTMQGVADAAAVSAVNAVAFGGPDIATQAKGIAAQNGWADGSNGVTVTVNKPPSVGNFTGNAQAVEVIIAQPQSLFFSGLLPGMTAPNIRARAVAAPNPSAGSGCLVALGGGDSLLIQGNGTLTLNGCDADGNGNLKASGNGVLKAHTYYVGGTASTNGNGGIQLTNGPGKSNYSTPFLDPYAGGVRSFVKPSTCSTPYSGGSTISPGAYCGGLTITSTVTMAPGVYFIEGGPLQIKGNAKVTSAPGGVTFVLTNSTSAPSTYATVTIDGNAIVNLTAPTDKIGSNDTRGIIFFGDPAQPAGVTENFQGNGALTLDGAIYFPNQTISLAGNGSLSAPTCLQVIGKIIKSTGNGALSSNCIGTGVIPVSATGAGATRLVE